MASGHANQTGHIKTIFMRNIGHFVGLSKLDLFAENSIEGNIKPGITGLVGAEDTSKSELLNLICMVNLLRGQDFVEKLQLKNPFKNVHFHKPEVSEDGLLVVETTDDNAVPVYYGLYSRPGEPGWYWQKQENDKHDKCRSSTVFLYRQKKMYILSPQLTTEHEVIFYNVEEIKKEDILNSLINIIEYCLKNHQKGIKTSNADFAKNLLPVCVPDLKTGTRPLKTCYEELGELMPKSMDTRCFLMDNTVMKLNQKHSSVKRVITQIKNYCEYHNFQVIATINNPAIIDRVCPVVRFWKTTTADRKKYSHAMVVKQQLLRDMLRSNEDRKYTEVELLDILTYSTTMLVGDTYETNVLEKVFEKWKQTKGSEPEAREKALFKHLADETVCISVGKCSQTVNFSYISDILFGHSYLGFCHYIVSDRDNIGSAQKGLVDQRKCIPILCPREGVLYKCVKHLCKKDQEAMCRSPLQSRFKKLYTAICQKSNKNNNQNTATDHQNANGVDQYTRLIELIMDDTGYNACQHQFAEDYLEVFSWSKSLLNAVNDAGSTQYTKDDLENEKKASRAVCSMINNDNDDLNRLKKFLLEFFLNLQ